MKIMAVGLNYPAHNKELENTLELPEAPVIFMKPDSALLKSGKPFFVPDFMGRVDYEGELVVRICRLGKSVPERFAHRYYDAVTVGVDFTARDMQARLRAKGYPWELSKGFDGAAVIGDWLPVGQFAEVNDIGFSLAIDGATVQSARSGEMIFGIDRLVSYVSRFCTLKTGDLLYTGTPAGVGPVRPGQHVEGFIEGEKVLNFNIR